jgi:threonine/homoserine/homoserine lactone efflux protein
VGESVIYLVTSGALLGLTAGMSPGPLMTLIIAESLRGGWPAGFRVSIAPLVTDTVLVTLALLIASQLPAPALSAISLVGGAFLVYMGWGIMRTRVGEPSAEGESAAASEGAPVGNPLARGIATNLLNPQAFLFWLTVGGEMLTSAYRSAGWTGPLLFMAPFFAVMISINLVLSLSISGGRHLLNGAGYRWTLWAAGLLLALLGVWRAWSGVQGLLTR